MDCNSSPSAKKQKRNQKRPNTPGKVEKNGAGELSMCDVRGDVTDGSHTGNRFTVRCYCRNIYKRNNNKFGTSS